MMQTIINTQLLDSSLTFQQYMDLTKSIVDSPVPQGLYVKESTMRYTISNLERMHKTLKETVISQRLYNLLSELQDEWIWLVVSEPWCGDASWGTPALYLFATATDKIDFRIILRDEHPEVISAYQTNGGNSIPKMVCLRKKDFTELGTWGPRPANLQSMVMQWKNDPGHDFRESVRQLHAWYENDMSKSIDEELSILVKYWKDKD